MAGNISYLPGTSELEEKLRESGADLVLAAYRTRKGQWKFYRCGDSEEGVSLEEIGAVASLQQWLVTAEDAE
jgi:hypothetical protein